MLLRLSWSSLLVGIVAGVLLLLLGGPSAVAWAVLSVVIGLAVALVALATYSVAALLRALTSLYMLIEDDWTARMRGAGDFGGGDGVDHAANGSRVLDVLAADAS
jgi:hypothetical protein